MDMQRKKTSASERDYRCRKAHFRCSVRVLDLPDAYYSNGLYTDRISVPSSAGVTCVTMLTCSTSASPE